MHAELDSSAVMLGDVDRQQSSRGWLKRRDPALQVEQHDGAGGERKGYVAEQGRRDQGADQDRCDRDADDEFVALQDAKVEVKHIHLHCAAIRACFEVASSGPQSAMS